MTLTVHPSTLPDCPKAIGDDGDDPLPPVLAGFGGTVTGALTGRDAQTITALLPDLVTDRDFPEQVTETL